MANYSVDVLLQIRLGPQAVDTYSKYMDSGFFTGEFETLSYSPLKVFAESNLTVPPKEICFFKLDMIVEVPVDYVAYICRTYRSPDIGVEVFGDIIDCNSYNKALKGYIRNNTVHEVTLRKGDILGELIIQEMYEKPKNYHIEFVNHLWN